MDGRLGRGRRAPSLKRTPDTGTVGIAAALARQGRGRRIMERGGNGARIGRRLGEQ